MVKKANMAKRFPLHPKHPERICWGCDRYCPKESLGCGNGSDRTQHPAELLGEDWYLFGDWGLDENEEKGRSAVEIPENSHHARAGEPEQ